MKKFISFSGGVESTTMCILYGHCAHAIWCDTGSEHQEMYNRIDFVEKEIKLIHPNFELIRIKPKVKAKGEYVNTLEEYIQKYEYMPSHQQRFCTKYFKIIPIDNFLKDKGKCELMIGLNADEENRIGNAQKMKNVTYTYPLIRDNKDRNECEAILEWYGLHPEFPLYMKRGGCRMCFFKGIKEYKCMYIFNPKEFNEILQFELSLQKNKKRFYTIIDDDNSLQDIKNDCDREIAMFGLDAVKNMYNKEKIKESGCGYFCMR